MHNLHMQHGHRVPHLEQRPLVSVKPAAPPLSASRQPRLQARKQADTVVEDVSQEQQQEATGFSAVVQKLLHRAASSLTRGQTTCLTCKGQGTCTCPACSVSETYGCDNLTATATGYHVVLLLTAAGLAGLCTLI
jgi:hypothetical protein